MAVSSEMIKDLREKTGAGILDCKKALEANEGDVEKSLDYLRKKGLASAAKKTSRIAAEGKVHAYIHGEGRIGVLVEVNCETDFVARNDDFKAFAHAVSMHIAAFSPQFVRREEVSADLIERERNVLLAQARESGKPEKVIEKMVEGRLEKYFGEVCLLEQKFILDQDKTVQTVMTELIAKLGENINVRRFVRYGLGDGLEKKSENFADEVARTAQS